MNVFAIKLIGIISMAVAHIGYFFFPESTVLFIVGRLAFPIFAFLIANGAYHAHNIYHYLVRLFIFAVISQIPFVFAHRLIDEHYWHLNILFTLSLGLLGIIVLRQSWRLIWKAPLLCVIFILAVVLQVDYGVTGVAAVLLSYIFYTRKALLLAALIALLSLYQAYQFVMAASLGIVSLVGIDRLLPYSLLAVGILGFYNGRRGVGVKWLFYIFYPLHYAVIYFIYSAL